MPTIEKPRMKISLTKAEVLRYSRQYDYGICYEELVEHLRQAAKRGHMTLKDLVDVANWKSGGRTRPLVEKNAKQIVKKKTGVAFSSSCERLRIDALLDLEGVGWPMASVILHFAFPDRYPILDKWAMAAVCGSTNYTFERWLEYTKLCRTRSKRMGVTMRTLDRALWTSGKRKINKRKKQRRPR